MRNRVQENGRSDKYKGADKAGEKNNNSEYDVHHSTSIYLIDGNGLLRVLVPFGKTIADIEHDLRLLLNKNKNG